MSLSLFDPIEFPVPDLSRKIVIFNEAKDAQIRLKQLPLTDAFTRIPAHSSIHCITERIAEERITLQRPAANDWASDIAYWILAGSVFASLIEFFASLQTGW
jgi:hypothetical protein